jgi:hypothetical protein
MKLGVVPQWGRAGTAPIPPDSRLARRAGANPRASPPGGVRSRVERGGRPGDGAPPDVESWTTGDASQSERGARRRFPVAGRPPSWAQEGACRGPPRGLSAGPACIGVTWERGRPPGLLAPCPARGTGRPQALAGPGGFHQGASPSGPPRTPRQHARERDASAERSAPRRAGRASARRLVPVQGGTRGPRDPREGRRRRASRCGGRKAGRDVALPKRHHDTPPQGRASGPRYPAWVDDVGPPERRRRPAGGLAPHAPGERRGSRGGHGAAVCRPPGRDPARPARASPPWGRPRAARRARVVRAGRGGPAPEWAPDVRGHDGPGRGGDAGGSARRAGRSGPLRGLAAGPQPPGGTARTTRAVHDGGQRLGRGRRCPGLRR